MNCRKAKGRRTEIRQICFQERPLDNGDKKRPIHNVQGIRRSGDGTGGGRSAGHQAGRERRAGRNGHGYFRRERPIFPEYGQQGLRQKDEREKLPHSKKRRFGHQDFQGYAQNRPIDGGQNYRPRRRRAYRYFLERTGHQSVFVRDSVFGTADSRRENNENETRRQYRDDDLFVKK